MNKERAEQIIKNVACHCDGQGVTPGPNGIAIKCPDCDGEFISYALYKEARQTLCEHQWEAIFLVDDDYAQCKLCGAHEEISNVECINT